MRCIEHESIHPSKTERRKKEKKTDDMFLGISRYDTLEFKQVKPSQNVSRRQGLYNSGFT